MTDKEEVRIGPLDTYGGRRTEMGRVYRQMRRGKIDTLDGARLVGVLAQMNSAEIASDLERRMDAFEASRRNRWGWKV